MQARRLIISRGAEAAADAGPPRPRPTPAPPADHHLVHHRLSALERLAALRDRGTLSADEFAAEKALVLRLPAEELLLPAEAALPRRGPSLLGRLLSARLLAAGAAAGLCLSAFTAPQDLAGLVDRAARLLG